MLRRDNRISPWESAMKVLVFGYGNLGQSIIRFCKEQGYPSIFISRRFHTPQFSTSNFIDEYEADIVINTVGGNIWDDFETLWRLNITDNETFLRMYSHRPYIAFSTREALEPWSNPYAATKNALECLTRFYENLFIIRICTCFPNTGFDFSGVITKKIFSMRLDDQIQNIAV